MKKISLMLILILAMTCVGSSLAVADTGHYTAGVNSYSNDSSHGARTVLIYKGGSEDAINASNIYYIDQTYSEYGFSDLEMMMKRDVPAGFYTLVTDKGGRVATFEISKAQARVAGNEEMKYLGAKKNQDGETYCVAFGISTKSSLTNESKLSMLLDDKFYTGNLFGDNSIVEWQFGPISYKDTQGAERAMFAIQFNGVSAEYVSEDGNGNVTPNFKLYLEN